MLARRLISRPASISGNKIFSLYLAGRSAGISFRPLARLCFRFNLAVRAPRVAEQTQLDAEGRRSERRSLCLATGIVVVVCLPSL